MTHLDEAAIYDIILKHTNSLRPKVQRLWEAIRVDPEEWEIGDPDQATKRFWVCGLLGKNAIWFNHLEDGFVISQYVKHGRLEQYDSGGFELSFILEQVLRGLAGEQAYSS